MRELRIPALKIYCSDQGNVVFMKEHMHHSVKQNKESSNNPHKYFNVYKLKMNYKNQKLQTLG